MLSCMLYKCSFEPLGVSPFGSFAPSEKRWPLVLAAGIGATASLIGTGASAMSNSAANAANLEAVREQNKTNLQIARENNATSQGQFNRNMQWLEEQFYKQREFELQNQAYNTPEAITNRLRQAGINPAYAIGQYGTGSASSSVSPVGAPSPSQLATAHMEAGHVEPFNYDFTGISEAVGHSINAYYQNKLLNEQTKSQEADTQIKRATAATAMMREINNLRQQEADIVVKLSQSHLNKSEREKLEADRDSIRQQINYFNDIQSELKSKLSKENMLLDKQYEKIDSDIDLNRVEMVLRPALAQANIRLSRAQESKFLNEIPLLVEQTKNAILQGDNINADTMAKHIENRLKHIIAEGKEGYEGSVKNGHFFGIPLTDIRYASKFLGELVFGELKGLLK